MVVINQGQHCTDDAVLLPVLLRWYIQVWLQLVQKRLHRCLSKPRKILISAVLPAQIVLVKILKITTQAHSSELYYIDWLMTIEHLKYIISTAISKNCNNWRMLNKFKEIMISSWIFSKQEFSKLFPMHCLFTSNIIQYKWYFYFSS